MDAREYIHIQDRTKDVIVRRRMDLFHRPRKRNHGASDVVEAAVIGVPDERWDERPLACVVLREGVATGFAELRAFLDGRVAKWWIPERWALLAEIPKTSVGKFDKKRLRATNWATHQQPLCYFHPMNPYAAHVGERAPLEVISDTPRVLAQLVETLGPRRLETNPAPGKWSAREILCHLADCEVVFGYRLRQTLAENHHVIQPFDQDLWAKNYSSVDARLALATLSTVRAWNLALIRSVPPADLSKAVTHPERGAMTFQTIVETMAGHDRNHIKQIEAIAAQSANAT